MVMVVSNPFEIVNNYTSSIPVDVEACVRAFGVKLNYAHLDAQIAGMVERIKDGSYLITVNVDDPLTRQRFTIAHELGHFIYHRDKMGDGIDDDRMYRSTNVGKHHNTRIGPREETQANQFAASLLMPWTAITRLQSEGVREADAMARRLIVSPQAMRIRLGLT
jgi:Zn-dependent peptidase ImmA (M78 family)